MLFLDSINIIAKDMKDNWYISYNFNPTISFFLIQPWIKEYFRALFTLKYELIIEIIDI